MGALTAGILKLGSKEKRPGTVQHPPTEKDPLANSAHGETPITQFKLLSVLDKTRSTDLMTRRTVLETSATPSCKKSSSILNSATKPPLLPLLPVPATRMLLLRTRPTSS